MSRSIHPGASLLGAVLLVAAGAAAAACSRPIQVPVSASTRMVFLDGSNQVSGVLPDLVREQGPKYGCTFVFQFMPRARAEARMFGERVGDAYMPALRRPEREAGNVFVPLFAQGLAVVYPIDRSPLPGTLEALVADPKLRGVLIRGARLGQQYSAAVDRLTEAQRVDFVGDGESVRRMLLAQRVDFTLLLDLVGLGSLEGPHTEALKGPRDFRMQTLTDVAKESDGVYLSRTNLDAQDLEQLTRLFEESRRNGSLKRAFLNHYPRELIENYRF